MAIFMSSGCALEMSADHMVDHPQILWVVRTQVALESGAEDEQGIMALGAGMGVADPRQEAEQRIKWYSSGLLWPLVRKTFARSSFVKC